MKEQSVMAVRQYSGPLPEPTDLEKYDKVIPGAAERILKMAEKEQECRLNGQKEERMLKSRLAIRGQIIGAMLALIFAAMSLVFAFNGHEKLSAMFGAPLIIWVCTIFVLRKEPKIKS